MKKKSRKSKTIKALERVVKALENGDSEVVAYMCTLRLPEDFSRDQKESNCVYKKTISDFCKSVHRGEGDTPRYVTVRTENDGRPEYAICLFCDKALDKPEDYAEHGRAIANAKCAQAGWGLDGKIFWR